MAESNARIQLARILTDNDIPTGGREFLTTNLRLILVVVGETIVGDTCCIVCN
jgi:hypothetical protein